MKLTKEYFEKWLNGLKQLWLNKNLDELEKYFGKIERYYETPFSVGKSFDEVFGFWKEIKNQQDIKLVINPIALNGNIGIAHWFLSDKSGEYDGVYQVVFNEKLECVEFRQWCEAK